MRLHRDHLLGQLTTFHPNFYGCSIIVCMRKNLGGGEENHLDRNDVGRESGDVQVLFLISLNFSPVCIFIFFTCLCSTFWCSQNKLCSDHFHCIGGVLLCGSSCGENCWSTLWSVKPLNVLKIRILSCFSLKMTINLSLVVPG